MALTVSSVIPGVNGSKRTATFDVAFDASYPTGGEALAPGQVGLQVIESAVIERKGGYLFEWDYTNQKIKVFSGGGADITPAGSVAAPIFSGSALGTHSHTVAAKWCGDFNGVVAPTIALTHNADPAGGLAAAPVYVVENGSFASGNQLLLYSTTNANASVLGETADGTVYGAAASARFWVNDSDTPAGVQVYINEAASDRLEFVSPSATDGYIIMPMETGYGFGVKVQVFHSAAAATGKALYFDDNGAADAQLVFVDAGAAGGTVSVTSVEVVGPPYVGMGAYFAGTAFGVTAGTPAGTNSAPAFTGTAVAAGAADEVDNGTNLSTLTGVRCTFTGY